MVLRIAQVSHLFETVPPSGYGGTERVVSWLTEELVKMSDLDVTLFASGDSKTDAHLRSIIPQSLRTCKDIRDWVPVYMAFIETIMRSAGDFDLIHSHIDTLPFPAFTRQPTPFLSTVHGRLDLPEYALAYSMFPNVPLVSVSNNQRQRIHARWIKTVHHGLPTNLLTPGPFAQEYLAFLGRISPEKGIHAAIRIARQAGIPLRIAAKIDNVDLDYYECVIKKEIDGSLIQYVGEIGDAQKADFLGRAYALLFPIDWPEPFGLAMIEALACGTPVIAYDRASVPEIIEDGLTGFVVKAGDEEAAVRSVSYAQRLDRKKIRSRFEEKFTASRMALEYRDIYRALLQH